MSEKPGYLRTLECSARWGIEPMFSDFKSRGFGIEDTQLRYADRLDRLILVMSLALYVAVSTRVLSKQWQGEFCRCSIDVVGGKQCDGGVDHVERFRHNTGPPA